MTDSRFAPTTDPGKPRAYVSPARKDGKFKVEFVYPVSGRRLVKVLTQDAVAALHTSYIVRLA